MKKMTFMAAFLLLAALECAAQNIVAEKEVDLGLSVNWAGWNIDASAPEQNGGFYAWGEIEEKSDYTIENYKFFNGAITAITKYNYKEGYGVIDNKTILDPEDDVAQVKWGDGWRMASSEELHELLKKCKWTQGRYNEVNGWIATGPNGKSIFFPYAGNKYNGRYVLEGMSGMTCSGELNARNPYAAEGFYYLSGRITGFVGLHRFYGRPVRAVRSK